MARKQEPTLAEAALSSARELAVAFAKFPSWRAAAWSPTVGTAAFAAATIFPAGYTYIVNRQVGRKGLKQSSVDSKRQISSG